MSFCAISDIHVHPNCPENEKVLRLFFEHPKVKASSKIFLLGDIFDVMIGFHKEYYAMYAFFFDAVERFLREGKEIHYFEGNHDFHLKKLMNDFLKEKKLKGFFIYSYHLTLKAEGKTFYFSHGDDIELGKPKYKSYKALVTAFPINYVANYFVPFWFLDWIGNKLSKGSKQRNHNRYNDPAFCEMVKMHFRESARKSWEKHSFDFQLVGHSHVTDYWEAKEGFVYANTGPAFLSKQFLFFENQRLEFISLSSL